MKKENKTLSGCCRGFMGFGFPPPYINKFLLSFLYVRVKQNPQNPKPPVYVDEAEAG
jgi:hypothetical protein